MKKTMFLMFAVLAMAQAQAFACDKGVNLVIMTGQSNMVWTPISDLYDKADGRDMVVVKWAAGGKAISHWDLSISKGGKGYLKLMRKVHDTMTLRNRKIKSVTLCFFQGEEDGLRCKSGYYQSFCNLLEQIENSLNLSSPVNIVIARINDYRNTPCWNEIRAEQEHIAGVFPNARMIDTDGLNGANNAIHFDKATYKIIGDMFALEVLGLLER